MNACYQIGVLAGHRISYITLTLGQGDWRSLGFERCRRYAMANLSRQVVENSDGLEFRDNFRPSRAWNKSVAVKGLNWPGTNDLDSDQLRVKELHEEVLPEYKNLHLTALFASETMFQCEIPSNMPRVLTIYGAARVCKLCWESGRTQISRTNPSSSANLGSSVLVVLTSVSECVPEAMELVMVMVGISSGSLRNVKLHKDVVILRSKQALPLPLTSKISVMRIRYYSADG